MLDLDHFKEYNDTFGHPAGDEILRRVGSTLRSALRSHDVVARYGGEEFVVLLPATDEDEAMVVAERLRSSIAGMPGPGARSPPASASEPSASTPAARRFSWNRPTAPLYQSKQAGRNRVTHFRACELLPQAAECELN